MRARLRYLIISALAAAGVAAAIAFLAAGPVAVLAGTSWDN